MPPESLCGYSSKRRSGEGMRTRLSISIACSLACCLVTGRWRRITSTIWSPTVKAGLSDVIGSWKIIEIWLPRRSRISAGLSFRRSMPSNRISPEAIRPGGRGINPMIESAVTLLPQPDSPTMPSVRPGLSEKLTPSTARNSPLSVSKYVARFLTSRSERAVAAPAPGPMIGFRAGWLKIATSAASRLQCLLHPIYLGVDDRPVENARRIVARWQEAVEHQVPPASLLIEATELDERLRMVVDPDVEPRIFFAGVDL